MLSPRCSKFEVERTAAAYCFGDKVGDRLAAVQSAEEAPRVTGVLSPLWKSSTLATTRWCRQSRRRAPGARIGAPEGPVRGSGTALHPFTLCTTPVRQRLGTP
jgi:hypothetical protein